MEKTKKKTVNAADKTATTPKTKTETLLQAASVEAICAEHQQSPDERLTVILGTYRYMQGATQDFAEIREICRRAFAELIAAHVYDTSYEPCYNVVKTVVKMYDTEVINMYRQIETKKRLALFIYELTTQMLKIERYRQYITDHYFEGDVSVSASSMRGVVLENIITEDAMEICGDFFRNEILRSRIYRRMMVEQKGLFGNGQTRSVQPEAVVEHATGA